MAQRHLLKATPTTVRWGSFAASYPAVLRVASGDTVTIETVSALPDELPKPPYEIPPELPDIIARCPQGPGPHFMTGPIWVDGAEPGDVLEIRIKDIALRSDWGWNVIRPHRGALPDDFPYYSYKLIPIDRARGLALPPWGGTLALAPFFGVLGVAPPANWGVISSIEPRAHGGNIDLKNLTPGSTLYLPVWNEGALFSAGDGHGVQGDGEVCLTALETSLTGMFELHLRKDMSLNLPLAETLDHWITLAFDPDLDDAAVTALREMIALIQRLSGISAEDAYRLCSLGCDLRITQMVDGNKGVHAMMAKSILAGLAG